MRDVKLKTWGVKNHKKDIANGHKAIVWVTGADAGCYALCEIVSGVLESEASDGDEQSLESVIEAWQVGRVELKKQSRKLFRALGELGFGGRDE